MATKNINGSYPIGYALNPAYQTLNMGAATSVGGAGVTTVVSQPSTINNLGNVQGTANGITLSDGGSVTNGSTTNTTALIEGTKPIVVNKAAATITNYGTIQSDAVVSGYDSYSGPGITLTNGGTVANASTGQIKNGISIAGEAGLVINNGAVGGSKDLYYKYHGLNEKDGPSVTMTAGGSVTNGSDGNTTATMNGVDVSGGVGVILNNGTMHGTYRYRYNYIGGLRYRDYSVYLESGGQVTNGSASNTSATIENGVESGISGLTTVTNYGVIFGSYTARYILFNTVYGIGTGVNLRAGGTVTNGSATDTSAKIVGSTAGVAVGSGGSITNFGTIEAYEGFLPGYFVSTGAGISNGTLTNGSVTDTTALISADTVGVSLNFSTATNFGTIENTYSYSRTRAPVAVALARSTITNGSATGTQALISGTTGVAGTGTIVNFGTIEGTGGVAIAFGNLRTNQLVEEGTGVLIGTVAGAGGILSLAGDAGEGTLTGLGTTIAGFATVDVLTGANWTLTGPVTVASNTVLRNDGSLTVTGTVTNSGTIDLFGQMINSGAIVDQTGSKLLLEGDAGLTADPVLDADAFSSAGLIEKMSGTGTSIISTGTASLTSSGTIDVESGTLELIGATIEVTGKLQGAGTIELGAGATTLATASGPVTVASKTVLRSNGSLTVGGAVTNSGTIDLFSQTINSGSIIDQKGSKLLLEGDVGITTDPAINADAFSSAGLVEKVSGTGTSIISTGTASLTSSGTIDVESGTLELTGATIAITGAITGAGTIEFATGATTFGTGTSLTVAGLTIAGNGAQVTVARTLGYTGAFSAGSGTELTIGTGATFTLSGPASFLHNTVDGVGRLTTTGATTVNLVTLGGTAQWYNAGLLTETSALTIGDSLGNKAIFVNQAAGVFDLAGNVGIAIGSATTSTFTNQGLVTKTVGGMSTIGIAVANTGTLESASGTLDLQQAVTGIGGTLKIDSGTILQADNSVVATQTVVFNGTNAKLTLTDAKDFLAKVSGFDANDRLDLTQFGTGTTISYAGNTTTGKLTVTDGALKATISFLGDYAPSGFHMASDGHDGTLITYSSPADSVDYSSATGGVYVDLDAQFTEHAPAGQGWSGGPSSVIPISTDELSGIQNVTASSWDDLLVGGTHSGVLSALAGNDLLYGNTSQATADNASQLTLDGGAGSNALYGSSGFNTFMAGDANGGFNQIWGAASKMAGVSGFANNTLSFAETASGQSVYVDLLNGHNAYINSGPQNNGSYTLEDSISNVPNVIGSSGGDVVIADNGTDRVTGGAGADQLYAGTGTDAFVYTGYDDSNLVTGYDALYGFKAGTDKVDLSALHSDASHLLIQTSGTTNSIYLEATPGSFNANTDLAMVVNTTASGGVHASDFIF